MYFCTAGLGVFDSVIAWSPPQTPQPLLPAPLLRVHRPNPRETHQNPTRPKTNVTLKPLWVTLSKAMLKFLKTPPKLPAEEKNQRRLHQSPILSTLTQAP